MVFGSVFRCGVRLFRGMSVGWGFGDVGITWWMGGGGWGVGVCVGWGMDRGLGGWGCEEGDFYASLCWLGYEKEGGWLGMGRGRLFCSAVGV